MGQWDRWKYREYALFDNDLASSGFVVIATEDEFTGRGQTILHAANYMVQQNSSSTSIFYHKLNITQIGAAGASQGAGGSAKALIRLAD